MVKFTRGEERSLQFDDHFPDGRWYARISRKSFQVVICSAHLYNTTVRRRMRLWFYNTTPTTASMDSYESVLKMEDENEVTDDLEGLVKIGDLTDKRLIQGGLLREEQDHDAFTLTWEALHYKKASVCLLTSGTSFPVRLLPRKICAHFSAESSPPLTPLDRDEDTIEGGASTEIASPLSKHRPLRERKPGP
ncbi:hypothetical protein KEM54_002314 [Ascosphaera aggregata]|nr:hypothetical protein KEM54_002314 [Ascosphaera aggregata]